MAENNPDHFRMEREDFVQAAKAILDAKGADYRPGSDWRIYEDERVRIQSNYNGLDLEITRKAMPDVSPDLRGTNPTTMVKDGQVIRHHGEHAYIAGHISKLATSLARVNYPCDPSSHT